MQCKDDACVSRLAEEGSVAMTIVVHVDDIFAVGKRERCDLFGRDLGGTCTIWCLSRTWGATLLFGMRLRGGLREGSTDDFPADVR